MSNTFGIIQPKGKIVARVTIEVDEKGRTEIKAVTFPGRFHQVTGGAYAEVELPMHQSAKASLLCQVLLPVLMEWNSQCALLEKGPKEDVH